VRNVFVQPLGVDLQTFHPGARDKGLRAELGIAEDTRLLIFAGRGSKEKNLPVLLKCMQRLGPRYHLLLVGSSMPAVVPDNVSVIDGFCPAATVARLMASADALMHAGDQETFGLVILEAMACGFRWSPWRPVRLKKSSPKTAACSVHRTTRKPWPMRCASCSVAAA
jgi:alpha-1,6-mannosyltransferase